MSEDDDWLSETFRDPARIAREGAADEGAEADDVLAKLPRLLRYAIRALRSDPRDRLLAEIAEVAPEIADGAALWCERLNKSAWQPLVTALDVAAVTRDLPVCRALADVVRLLSMTVEDLDAHHADALRVITSLKAALREADKVRGVPLKSLAVSESIVLGWSIYASGDRERLSHRATLIHRESARVGSLATEFTRQIEREAAANAEAARKQKADNKKADVDAKDEESIEVPDGHVLVCPPIDPKMNTKVKEVTRGHEHMLGKPLPLVAMPDIAEVRRRLAFEFPYAEAALDVLLAPLVGRRMVGFPPVLIVGPPGAGKSRLARRLAECLGVGLWRTDGARADGSGFGGTDRRWYSAEPSHPMLAISRTRIANPIVLVDEIEKAATRADYGRLWDSMLGFLERETSSAYPDPCLQVDVDVSYVSYVATANSVLPLPSPLLDRFRVVEMPEPRTADLSRLVLPLARDILAEQQLDQRWLTPLATDELDLLATKWRGGSVRRLRAYLAVLIRARERGQAVN